MTNGEKIIALTGREPFIDTFGSPYMVFTKEWWDAEYKEPKQNIFDYLTATGQGMIEGEKIANDEWIKAINAIKDDFKGQAKRQKEKEERKSDGKVVEVFFGTKKILRTITKHTKELMK